MHGSRSSHNCGLKETALGLVQVHLAWHTSVSIELRTGKLFGLVNTVALIDHVSYKEEAR